MTRVETFDVVANSRMDSFLFGEENSAVLVCRAVTEFVRLVFPREFRPLTIQEMERERERERERGRERESCKELLDAVGSDLDQIMPSSSPVSLACKAHGDIFSAEEQTRAQGRSMIRMCLAEDGQAGACTHQPTPSAPDPSVLRLRLQH